MCIRDSCIDGRLTCRNRHIRGIGNQDRTLHQGLARLWILQFRELIQNVRHLVAALAAADANQLFENKAGSPEMEKELTPLVAKIAALVRLADEMCIRDRLIWVPWLPWV